MAVLNKFGQPVGDELPTWQPRPRPAHSQLNGQYCRLEPLNVDKHSEQLFTAWHLVEDNRDWTYFSIDRPATQAECDAMIAHNAASQDPLFFAVVDNQNGKAIGGVSLMRIDAENGVAEIGWVNWTPLMKRSRFGTEAIYLLLSHLFDTLQYRRCEWKCHSMNEASAAAAKRFGFQYEGTFRQLLVVKGRNRDTLWFSMLDHEWPEVKLGFQGWLDANNFDANGQQKQKIDAFMPL